MSSELIEDIEDSNGTSIYLTMSASGHARIILLSEHQIHQDMIGDTLAVDFRLPPNEEGLRAAEKIENALRAWREQIQTTNKETV